MKYSSKALIQELFIASLKLHQSTPQLVRGIEVKGTDVALIDLLLQFFAWDSRCLYNIHCQKNPTKKDDNKREQKLTQYIATSWHREAFSSAAPVGSVGVTGLFCDFGFAFALTFGSGAPAAYVYIYIKQ